MFFVLALFLPFLILKLVGQNTPEESDETLISMLVFYGYSFFAVFIWPFVFGGIIGEMASVLPERLNWKVFKEKAMKKYDRILLFSVFLSGVAILAGIGLGLFLFSSMFISGIKEAVEGENIWNSRFIEVVFEIIYTAAVQLFVLMALAIVTAITLAEKGFWRHLKIGIQCFFKESVLKLYLVFFTMFLVLNLLKNFSINDSILPSYFYDFFSILIPVVRSFLWIVAISFFLFLLKPQYEGNSEV